MVKASRKTKTIVARPPMYRDQLLKPIVNSQNDDSEDIFEDGLFEHYIVRPDCLENFAFVIMLQTLNIALIKEAKTYKMRMTILTIQMGKCLMRKIRMILYKEFLLELNTSLRMDLDS